MADEMMGLGPVCRNCVNTGIGIFDRKPCQCPAGQAARGVGFCLVCQQELPGYWRGGVFFCNEHADDTPVVEPVVSDVPPVDAQPGQLWIQPAQANEPRAIIQAFALLGMERKMAANDGVKGGWRSTDWVVLYEQLQVEVAELLRALLTWRHDRDDADAREAVLLESADVANYLAMICDVCGALPPTDERGR